MPNFLRIFVVFFIGLFVFQPDFRAADENPLVAPPKQDDNNPFKRQEGAAGDTDDVPTEADLKQETRRADEKKKAEEQKQKAEELKKTDVAKNAPQLPTTCPQCLGQGFMPSKPATYVVNVGEGKAEASVPWKFCSKCQASHDAKELIDTETARLSGAAAKKQSWQQKCGLNFAGVETHHASIYGNVPAAELTECGQALEQLASKLQTNTGTTLLTATRPCSHEMIFLADQASYNKMLDALKQPKDAIIRKTGGSHSRTLCTSFPKVVIPRKNLAVFCVSKMMIMESSDAKAPAWLQEGFAAYCENLITGSNRNYTIAYELNEVKFGGSWNAEVKKLAEQKKLSKWSEIFPIDLIGLGPIHYMTCYSMTSFLMTIDAKAFPKMVAMVRDGTPSPEAVEKAYGKKVKDLEVMWANWCLTLK
jgi:hypothetical protein